MIKIYSKLQKTIAVTSNKSLFVLCILIFHITLRLIKKKLFKFSTGLFFRVYELFWSRLSTLLSVCLNVCLLFHMFYLSRTIELILSKLYTHLSNLGWKGFKFVHMEDCILFYKLMIFLNFFFYKTTAPCGLISIKLRTTHPLFNGNARLL